MGTNFSRHSPKAEIQSKNEDKLENEGGNGYVLIPLKYLFATTGIKSPALVVGELSTTPQLRFPQCAGTSHGETHTVDSNSRALSYLPWCPPYISQAVGPLGLFMLHNAPHVFREQRYSCAQMMVFSEISFGVAHPQAPADRNRTDSTEMLLLYKLLLFSSSVLPGA